MIEIRRGSVMSRDGSKKADIIVKAYESAELNALADIGAMDKQDVKEILEGDKYFTK